MRSSMNAMAMAGLAMLLGSSLASAHDLSQSTAKLTIGGSEVRVALYIDLTGMPGFPPSSQPVSLEKVDSSIEETFRLVKEHYRLRAPDPPVHILLERYDLVDEHVLHMEMVEHFSVDVSRIEVTSTLDRITRPDHTHLVMVESRGEMHREVLSGFQPSVVFEGVQAQASKSGSLPASLTVGSLLRYGSILLVVAVLVIILRTRRRGEY